MAVAKKSAAVARGNKEDVSKKGSSLTTVTGSTSLAVYDADLDDGQTGLENVTAKDVMIPRLGIIQALSPQLLKNKPEYIEGAQVGDFVDHGVGDTFRDTLHLLPVFFATVYLEWAPRSTGKGLVKNHGTDGSIMKSTVVDDLNRNVLPNGNYIAETATYYLLNLSARGRRSFLPLTSTQLKNSRKWMTLITNERVSRPDGSEFMPPIYYRSWFAKTTEESNAKGDWSGWKFEPGPNILEIDATKKLLAEAKEFMLQVSQGLVSGDVASLAEEAAGSGGSSDNNGAM